MEFFKNKFDSQLTNDSNGKKLKMVPIAVDRKPTVEPYKYGNKIEKNL